MYRVTCIVLRVTCHVCRVHLFVMFNVHLTMFSRLRSLLDRNALNIPRIPALVAWGQSVDIDIDIDIDNYRY